MSFLWKKRDYSSNCRDNALLCGEQETIGGARLTFRNLAAARRKSELFEVGGGREGVQVRSEAPPFPAPAARTYNMHCCCFFVVVSVGGGATARESKWRKISAVISHYHVNQADSFAAIHCSLFSVMDAAIGFFSSIYLFAQCVVCFFFANERASERVLLFLCSRCG